MGCIYTELDCFINYSFEIKQKNKMQNSLIHPVNSARNRYSVWLWVSIAVSVSIISICILLRSQRKSTFDTRKREPNERVSLLSALRSNVDTGQYTGETKTPLPQDIDKTNEQFDLHNFATRKHFIYVDSDTYDPTTGKLEVIFETNLYNVIGLEMYSCSIPKSEYVISSVNNTFTFNNGSAYSIALTTGDYDAIELAAEIQSKIRAASSDSTFTCTYVAKTTTYSMTSTDAAFTISFSTAQRLLMYNIGFTSTSNTSTDLSGTHTLSTTGRVDLANSRYVQICSEEMRKHYVSTDIISTVDLSTALNYSRNIDESVIRTFPAPIKRWRSFTLQLYVKDPHSERRIYNNNNLVFHICFVAYTLTKKMNLEGIKHDFYY